jgi:hypothetical protein
MQAPDLYDLEKQLSDNHLEKKSSKEHFESSDRLSKGTSNGQLENQTRVEYVPSKGVDLEFDPFTTLGLPAEMDEGINQVYQSSPLTFAAACANETNLTANSGILLTTASKWSVDEKAWRRASACTQGKQGAITSLLCCPAAQETDTDLAESLGLPMQCFSGLITLPRAEPTTPCSEAGSSWANSADVCERLHGPHTPRKNGEELPGAHTPCNNGEGLAATFDQARLIAVCADVAAARRRANRVV